MAVDLSIGSLVILRRSEWVSVKAKLKYTQCIVASRKRRAMVRAPAVHTAEEVMALDTPRAVVLVDMGL